MGTSSGVFVRHGRSNSPLCHRTTLSDSFLAISIPTIAGSACLSATNDSIETCLTSTVRYASLFIGDDLLHVALLETESATLPLSRRPPPFFTIANSARKPQGRHQKAGKQLFFLDWRRPAQSALKTYAFG